MIMNPKAWIATAAVLVATSTASRADTKNEVRAVSFTEDGGITRVHVRGAQTPTFTVYKLERPSRVVIDLPKARLAEAMRGHESGAVFSPNTWAVSAIAAQQLDDGAVRVIVTLARPGRYDVKTEGNDVVVKVMPRDAAPTTTNPAELEQAKRQAAAAEVARAAAERSSQAANATATQSRAEADMAKAEAERLRTAAAQQAARAEAAQRAVDEARHAAQKNASSAADLDRAKKLAQQAKDEAARANAQAAKASGDAELARKTSQLAQIEADKLRIAAEQARRDAQAEAAAAKAEVKVAQAEATKARDEMTKAKGDAELAKREAAAAKTEAQQAKAAAARAQTDAEVTRAAAKEQEAHARTALASAQAREQAARDAAKQADNERRVAETAAKRAQTARDNADAADRAKLVTEAKAAEARLAKARTAMNDAEARRIAAEQLASNARKDLDSTKQALATVEQQRAAAEKKRQAVERASDELAARTKAEAKAQAEMAAAKARKASDDEIAAARREVARLTDERKRAESELADRKKAVAMQQSEASRLEAESAKAREDAAREEARRSQLAQQREQEERELAKLKAHKVQAQVATTQQRSTPAPKPATPATPATPVTPVAPAAATPIAKVQNVTFKGNDGSGIVELSITGDASVALGEVSSSTVELIVDRADLAQKLERTLDVSKFGSPVKKVSTFRDRRATNRVRLVAELTSPAIPTVVRDGNVVRWRFASTDAAKKTAKTTSAPPPTVVGGFGASSTPVAQQSVAQLPGSAPGNRRRTYYGATVEFDFKDAPIHDLLRIIADTGNVNIVVPDNIDAKVTVKLKRVPWDQALEVILASHALWYRREGNLYRIAPRKELDAEDEAEAARRAAMVQAEPPKPEIVTLNYASADELKTKLEGMLSPKGKIEVDGRTNSLIINDVAGNRENIARLALQLDTETPQITIEARIVEAQSSFVRQIGIQWGGRALAGAGGGNATGLIFPSSIGIRGANSDAQTPEGGISALPSDFAINLPSATGTGEGGAIGMSLGSVGGNFNINLRLSALEDTGTVRIVSAPKITVLNNKAALIRSGVSIPISVVSAAGTQTQFVQADLKLEVTPYVSQRDCRIAMNLDVTKNEPDFVNVGARGDPTILRREARTTMLVGDGETTVLGGIYTRNSGLAYKKVPFFGDLPVIGWFFKNRRENDTRTEILVFITPKITNKASLRCVQ